MLITNNHFRLYYWKSADKKSMGGPAEINTNDYYYDLQSGQKLHAIRFYGSNKEMYFNISVVDVSDEGINILADIKFEKQIIFVPWVKSLPNAGIYEDRIMFIEPCEYLFENNSMSDILSENIATETYKESGELLKADGRGIWNHGKSVRKSYSRFANNLNRFVPKQLRI